MVKKTYDNRNVQAMEEMQNNYINQVKLLAQERDEITKEYRRLEEDVQQCRAIQQDTYFFFQRVGSKIEESGFTKKMEECESEFREYSIKLENSLEERKEELELEKRHTYDKEEDIKQQFQ